MLEFIGSNISSIIVSLIIIAGVVMAVRVLTKQKKTTGCAFGCPGCHAESGCDKKDNKI